MYQLLILFVFPNLYTLCNAPALGVSRVNKSVWAMNASVVMFSAIEGPQDCFKWRMLKIASN